MRPAFLVDNLEVSTNSNSSQQAETGQATSTILHSSYNCSEDDPNFNGLIFTAYGTQYASVLVNTPSSLYWLCSACRFFATLLFLAGLLLCFAVLFAHYSFIRCCSAPLSAFGLSLRYTFRCWLAVLLATACFRFRFARFFSSLFFCAIVAFAYVSLLASFALLLAFAYCLSSRFLFSFALLRYSLFFLRCCAFFGHALLAFVRYSFFACFLSSFF
nr:nuclear transcription factor Y subunit A-5-like isoform X1 [Ipomoea batatas]